MAKGDDVYGKDYAKQPSFLDRLASMGSPNSGLDQIGYQNPTGFANPQSPAPPQQQSPINPSSQFQYEAPGQFKMGSDPSGMSGIGPEKPQTIWDKLKGFGERLKQEEVRRQMMEQMKRRRPGDI